MPFILEILHVLSFFSFLMMIYLFVTFVIKVIRIHYLDKSFLIRQIQMALGCVEKIRFRWFLLWLKTLYNKNPILFHINIICSFILLKNNSSKIVEYPFCDSLVNWAEERVLYNSIISDLFDEIRPKPTFLNRNITDEWFPPLYSVFMYTYSTRIVLEPKTYRREEETILLCTISRWILLENLDNFWLFVTTFANKCCMPPLYLKSQILTWQKACENMQCIIYVPAKNTFVVLSRSLILE